MAVEIVFETHSISEDNESGIATGWLPGKLSARGRELAKQLGERRRDDGLAAVFTSDLRRAIETSEIAFEASPIPMFRDRRLRECNYGDMNGGPAADVHGDRARFLDQPYPNGESWRQAVARVEKALDDLVETWDGKRILAIGHVATRWGLEHLANGKPLEELMAEDFVWKEGWEYRLG